MDHSNAISRGVLNLFILMDLTNFRRISKMRLRFHLRGEKKATKIETPQTMVFELSVSSSPENFRSLPPKLG